jgi:hypothetical protein
MGNLGFVDWRAVNVRFCVLMWAIAVALALVITSASNMRVANT